MDKFLGTQFVFSVVIIAFSLGGELTSGEALIAWAIVVGTLTIAGEIRTHGKQEGE